jgi:hypothetical protein
VTPRLEWVLNRMSRRGPSPDEVRQPVNSDALFTRGGMDPDDAAYEEVKRRRGRKEADAIATIRDRAPLRIPRDKAWRWAEQKYDERELAAEAGTGFDPDEEWRRRSDP